MTTASVPLAKGLSEIAGRYRGLLCDVWGVVHNGIAAFPAACEALQQFRAGGGAVVLLTNAPRPSGPIYDQLAHVGVPRDAFDSVVTSGDATQLFFERENVRKVFHLGPDRDLTLYDGTGIDRVDPGEAELVVCTGLFDDTTETPEDYRDLLAELKAKGLRLVCANPDVVVHRGDTLIWCAGALARDYAAIGGDVTIFGKPHAPIYDAALARLAEVAGADLGKNEVLAIGDGLPTDIAGACDQGLPTLFITGGIHAADFGPIDAPDAARVAERLDREGRRVVAAMPRLSW
ncbi:TIGR01459 family HAD-type hydrolase [Rhodobium gokarnense]|uniref:HAD superfamily hydrolase (TIGR01459 family) n=1 Tax=Rhodobium gokarnense TaxID=364296 RepID=A0ABT3HCM6_9HYPH|nr:TIGR01459 family HAD-type hydrolase [Rhodobium gokarnense]MCW2308157.1 HAD superfamily hydrolase (TIGR01459 family) [Rhodobium gokarnense]